LLGSQAREKVETDPYRLIAFLNSPFALKTWKEVDSVARDIFAIPPHDPRRLHGAVMSAIRSHYDKRNTVIDRWTLLGKLRDRLEDEKTGREGC